MKNKKGFAFVETVITLTIVTLSLSILLASYSLVARKSKEKEYYDKPGDKYLLYSIFNLINENNYNLSSDIKIDSSNCSSVFSTIFGNDESCNAIFDTYDIRYLYVVRNVMADGTGYESGYGLKSPSATSLFDNGTIEYMKTIKKCNNSIYIETLNENSIPVVKEKETVVECSDPVNYLIGVFYRYGKYYFASIPIDLN